MSETPNSTLRLSVLDQSPIAEGSNSGEALRNSIDLARLADQAGFTRYWVAEHHGTPALACSSPEVLIGPIAAATSRIRVGSGGIMLPHYSALKVASNFGMLASLFPGRIDLGIGRAAGTSPSVAAALQRDRRQRPPDDFIEQLQELLQYLENRPADAGMFARFSTNNIRFESPEPWLLGSSMQSAIWAAELGLPYVFADFINRDGAEAAEYYRIHFRPSTRLSAPRIAVAAWVICAPDDAEALELSLSIRMLTTMLFRGQLLPVPTVERAREFLVREGVPFDLLPEGRRLITGSPAKVRVELEGLAAEYGAEEILIVNIMHGHAERRRSYQLIAEEFGLASRLAQ